MEDRDEHESLMQCRSEWLDHGIHTDYGSVYLGDIDSRSAERVCKALFLCRSGVQFFINSEGGDFDHGRAIYDLIKRYTGESQCVIIGQASSAAAIIVQAFKKRIITPSSFIMIHDPVASDSDDVESVAEQLKKDKEWMHRVFATRSATEIKKWKKICAKDSYFNATEALRAGLVDAVDKLR
jgi:ATP-dependent Clp protease protease subunit